MSVRWIKQKIIFVNAKNPIDQKKVILKPSKATADIPTPIAGFHRTSSAILFHYIVENIFLLVIQLLTVNLITNNFILIQKKLS
jgi:hypothetical protein